MEIRKEGRKGIREKEESKKEQSFVRVPNLTASESSLCFFTRTKGKNSIKRTRSLGFLGSRSHLVFVCVWKLQMALGEGGNCLAEKKRLGFPFLGLFLVVCQHVNKPLHSFCCMLATFFKYFQFHDQKKKSDLKPKLATAIFFCRLCLFLWTLFSQRGRTVFVGHFLPSCCLIQTHSAGYGGRKQRSSEEREEER